MDLEDYLADQYNRDLQDIRVIEQLLAEVAAMFALSFDETKQCWPYELRAAATTKDGKDSQGTSAMILAAIGKMLGSCRLRDGYNAEKINKLSPDLSDIHLKGVQSLAKLINDTKKVSSTTFGDFDPLTISHLTELARSLPNPQEGKNLIELALTSLPRVAQKIEDIVREGKIDFNILNEQGSRGTPQWCSNNAFIALRIVRSHKDLDIRTSRNAFRSFFETRLHELLSFSSIPDSRFDPAELAFCLEGLLICAHESVDRVLFERVLTVLGDEQETSAYWRPNRPFVAKPTGEVMLPLSVEGANSLLNSVAMIDEKKLHGAFAVKALPMFRRFLQWLRARKVEVNSFNKRCVGWHSEHINEAGVIHLWDTSQVVEFLVSFRKLLQSHIARETLVLSRLKISEPEGQESWSDITADYEPLKDKNISDLIFDRINHEFLTPWIKNDPKNYSMLLYGPPGTGKTAIATSIANALKFRLITVTVSDFLGAGGVLVEARAKAIFQTLQAQSKCVIFFDEIDSFLLDRDSQHYRDQDTLFQFLTPGMLTKINDLREAKRSIFIIATNYGNRIDPAIKRPGRIDREYLLLPPDFEKRIEIIQEKLDPRRISQAEGATLAKASLYLGYKEIVGAVGLVEANASIESLAAALEKAPRSSSDQHYLARVGQETFPEQEFIAMIRMANQAGKISDVQAHIDHLGNKEKMRWKAIVNRSDKLGAALRDMGVKI